MNNKLLGFFLILSGLMTLTLTAASTVIYLQTGRDMSAVVFFIIVMFISGLSNIFYGAHFLKLKDGV